MAPPEQRPGCGSGPSLVLLVGSGEVDPRGKADADVAQGSVRDGGRTRHRRHDRQTGVRPAGATVPADVREVFARAEYGRPSSARAWARTSPAPSVPTTSTRSSRFSMTFVDGSPMNEPVVSTTQWVAALERGDEVLGTLGVWKPGGGPAQPNGYSNDVALGAALATLAATEILVHDEPTGSYYALAGTTVRPLNDWARTALPAPAELSELRATRRRAVRRPHVAACGGRAAARGARLPARHAAGVRDRRCAALPRRRSAVQVVAGSPDPAQRSRSVLHAPGADDRVVAVGKVLPIPGESGGICFSAPAQ